MACILSCFCSCSSSTQVLVSSDAPSGLKNSTFFLARRLARQIQDVDLSLQSKPVVKTESAIKVIKKLMKDARAQLSKISTPKTTTPIFERVGALSTDQLIQLQTKMQEIQDGLVGHGYVVKASPELVEKLFSSMTEFERRLELLNKYLDDVKSGISETRLWEYTNDITRFTCVINEVVDERSIGSDRRKDKEIKQGVSRALIAQLSESRAEKLQEKVANFYPEINKLIDEVSAISFIKPPASPPKLSRSIFIAPAAIIQPGLPATSPRPLRKVTFAPISSEGDVDSSTASTEGSPKLTSTPVLDGRISRYVIRARQQHIRQSGRAPSDEIEFDSIADKEGSRELRSASSFASFSQVAASKLVSISSLSNVMPNAVPEEDSF